MAARRTHGGRETPDGAELRSGGDRAADEGQSDTLTVTIRETRNYIGAGLLEAGSTHPLPSALARQLLATGLATPADSEE